MQSICVMFGQTKHHIAVSYGLWFLNRTEKKNDDHSITAALGIKVRLTSMRIVKIKRKSFPPLGRHMPVPIALSSLHRCCSLVPPDPTVPGHLSLIPHLRTSLLDLWTRDHTARASRELSLSLSRER